MRYEKIELKSYFDFLGDNGKNPTLELYLPDNLSEMGRQNNKRPCIVICPGGGYEFCSQREAEPIALKFLPLGFNAFILTYSTKPHRYPTQLREVAAVMELIYKNSESWHCDVSKTAIMGFSAGGHLAAHYSTSFDCPQIREVFPDSKPVSASVLCYPVISCKPDTAHMGSFENLLGHRPQTKEEENSYSCECLIKANTPPAFLWHTSEDGCVPVHNSLLYAAGLADKKIPFELHIYPYGDHGLSTCDRETINDISAVTEYASDWLSNLKKWLDLTLKL